MGTIIEFKELPKNDYMLARLLVYCAKFNIVNQTYSVSKELADGLLACKPNRRSMKLEQIFNNVLDRYPDEVTIKDIDVMFNPDYMVDVLKILIAARKRKRYSVIWPGRLENEKLIYGEEGYPDYKVYKIEDYDITCVR
ncbi:BREX-3 system P-loop-containing protein BrxF [Oribacterium sp. FC2011]|uniref:BREX-3 system P-loop-containing protein BrxF n=1 Tax=Oribacterium sp. FC2011 TaxID=1408311 RepID=UPI0004E253DD|nr:BREX-3 system P-loop-containing protein BrxF [Oribacterium sp. FC2011]